MPRLRRAFTRRDPQTQQGNLIFFQAAGFESYLTAEESIRHNNLNLSMQLCSLPRIILYLFVEHTSGYPGDNSVTELASLTIF